MSAGIPETGQVVITNKDIYFELRQLTDTVKSMTPQGEKIIDHETRIRALEKWKYALPASVLSAGVALYLSLQEHHG